MLKNRIIKENSLFVKLLFLAMFYSCSANKEQSLQKEKLVLSNNKWIHGAWIGRGEQLDINEHWDINLICDLKNNSFKISYPDLNCGEKWQLTKHSKNTLEFREKIKYGKKRCFNKGKVIIQNADSLLLFTYYYPNDTILNAKGQLFREIVTN